MGNRWTEQSIITYNGTGRKKFVTRTEPLNGLRKYLSTVRHTSTFNHLPTIRPARGKMSLSSPSTSKDMAPPAVLTSLMNENRYITIVVCWYSFCSFNIFCSNPQGGTPPLEKAIRRSRRFLEQRKREEERTKACFKKMEDVLLTLPIHTGAKQRVLPRPTSPLKRKQVEYVERQREKKLPGEPLSFSQMRKREERGAKGILKGARDSTLPLQLDNPAKKPAMVIRSG